MKNMKSKNSAVIVQAKGRYIRNLSQSSSNKIKRTSSKGITALSSGHTLYSGPSTGSRDRTFIKVFTGPVNDQKPFFVK
ncbi:MAG: hypothetical protein ACE3L7_32745 [Candidatus Pristimantibacillus sp.]